MLNKSGVTKTSYAGPRQILANVEMQASVGCVVPQALGVAVGSKKIAKAGTPINVDLTNRTADVKTPVGTTGAIITMNAVLLHDVDVTAGKANGTALIFGFVDLTKVENDVVTKITAAKGFGTPSPLLTFIK